MTVFIAIWLPIKTAPEERRVLLTSKEWSEYNNRVQIGELWDDTWIMDDSESAVLVELPAPTRWMLLPEPPDEL